MPTPEEIAAAEEQAAAQKKASDDAAALLAQKAELDAKEAELAKAEQALKAQQAAVAAVAINDTVEVDGQTIKVKFGVEIPGMGTYTKAELLTNPEVIAYLLEIKSGSIEIISQA